MEAPHHPIEPTKFHRVTTSQALKSFISSYNPYMVMLYVDIVKPLIPLTLYDFYQTSEVKELDFAYLG